MPCPPLALHCFCHLINYKHDDNKSLWFQTWKLLIKSWIQRTRNFRSNRLLVMRRKQNKGSSQTNFTSGFRCFFNAILFVCLIFWDWFVIQESEEWCQSWFRAQDWPQVFHFAGCQSPVLLLLRWASQLLVEGVGQEGQHCEGWEALADYLKGEDHGAVRATENLPSDWPAPPSVCSEAIALDISSVIFLQTFTRTETKIVGSALLRETVVTLLICPRNPRLDWLQMYSLSDSQTK